MNTSILCLVGLLAATPADSTADRTDDRSGDQAAAVVTTVYRPSAAFEAALRSDGLPVHRAGQAVLVRGQSPGFQQPIVVQPGANPAFGAPTFGGPTFGGPAYVDSGVAGPVGVPVQAPIQAPIQAPVQGPVLGPVPGPIYQPEPLPPSTVIAPGADPFLPGAATAPLSTSSNPYGGYYFGFEWVYVKPFFDSNPAMTVASPLLTSSNSIDFDWDLESSWRFFAGYSGSDGMGFRARYWDFDEGVSMSAAGSAGPIILSPAPTGLLVPIRAAAGVGETYIARQDLELNVLDLEGTLHEDLNWGSVTASAGVRLARIEEDKRFSAVGGAVPASLIQSYDFEGAGPTVSLLGRKRLFTTNASLFASGRFSLLYGESSFDELATAGPAVFGFAGNGDDDLIPVTELQFGVESSRCCRCFGGSTFFYRAAVESQVWFDALPSGNLGFLGVTLGSGWAF